MKLVFASSSQAVHLGPVMHSKLFAAKEYPMGLMMFTSCSLSAVNKAQETNVTVVAETQAAEEIAAKEVAESQVEEETAVKDEAETQVPEEAAKEEATTKDATETKIEDDTVIKNEMASASDVKGTREMTEEELQAMSEWVYSPNYDLYYSIHSDCYAVGYKCLEGTITINENGEEIDTIKLTSPISIDDPQRPIVTLKKTGDGYRILSCVYIEEK